MRFIPKLEASMAQSGWDDQFRIFLKRAGDDLKRMGEDIRTEATRLISQVQDPEKQEQMKARAKEVGVWARQAATEVADLVEKGAQKAETALKNFSAKEGVGKQAAEQTAPRAAASTPAPRKSGPKAAPKKVAAKKVTKTVGPKKKVAAKKKASGGTKTIGRKPQG